MSCISSSNIDATSQLSQAIFSTNLSPLSSPVVKEALSLWSQDHDFSPSLDDTACCQVGMGTFESLSRASADQLLESA